MHVNSKAHWLMVLILLLLSVNYLLLNLFRLDNSLLIYGRLASIILLLLSFSARPVIYKKDILLISVSFIAVIIGFPDNNIAINILFLLIFAVSMNTVQIDKTVGYGMFCLALSLVLILSLLYFGVTENKIDVVDGRERATFGFSNTNAFTSLAYSFIALGLYKWRRPTIVKYVLLFALAYVTYLHTDNRTIITSISIFALAHALFRLLAPANALKFISAFLLLLPIILTQASGFIVAHFPLIDELLSLRPSFSSNFISRMSWINYIFGGLSPGEMDTIDNAFLLIQASVGTPFLLFITWLTFKKLSDCIVKQQAEAYSLILSIWYFSFSESSMVRPEAIIGLIFWLIIFRTSRNYRTQKISKSNENSIA